MTGQQLFNLIRRHSIEARDSADVDKIPMREWDDLAHHEQVGWHEAASEIFEPWIVGLAKHVDDTGLDWWQVVIANSHGDATFQVFHGTIEGERAAEAVADMLVWLLDVLGVKAQRGEVDHA